MLLRQYPCYRQLHILYTVINAPLYYYHWGYSTKLYFCKPEINRLSGLKRQGSYLAFSTSPLLSFLPFPQDNFGSSDSRYLFPPLSGGCVWRFHFKTFWQGGNTRHLKAGWGLCGSNISLDMELKPYQEWLAVPSALLPRGPLAWCCKGAMV